MKRIINSGRKADTSPLKECIEEFLKNSPISKRYQETRITSNWERIVGKTIAARTSEIFVKNQVLYLKINSAPLKSELSMAKAKMTQLINNELGEEVVKEIVFI
ncbi:DUF721 domain-containing protein [Cytophagaceae bacterium ABcell3]|nr:DUF721 domain-containing protein [Cytophagaceae bacterium ABcell3]